MTSFRLKTIWPEWRNLLILTTMIALTGCKYAFELNDKDMKSMVAIQSYICADSLVSINIHKTVPLTQIGKADTLLRNPRYSLTCNGMEVEVRDSMIGAGGMSVSSRGFKGGDKIEFTFETEDMETAVASTVIPEPFPEHSAELTLSNNAERSLKIRYKDNPDTDDWYGAMVKWKGTQVRYTGINETESTNEVTDRSIVPPSGYGDINLEPEAYSPLLTYYDDNYLFFWKDSDEEDNEYDLCFNYRHQNDATYDKLRDVEIKYSLFKLSEEMYKYLFATFDSTENPFAYIGLSSPAFTYSNVRNGLGYLCGYSVIHSDWIKDNLIEE